MKATTDVIGILYQLVKESPLATEISGSIRKSQRPANSQKEDIVINCLPIDNEQLQQCDANVNIYVPCFKVQENDVEADQPDFKRLEKLEPMALLFFRSIREAQNYHIEWQTSQILKDQDSSSYFINVRLRFRAFNIEATT